MSRTIAAGDVTAPGSQTGKNVIDAVFWKVIQTFECAMWLVEISLGHRYVSLTILGQMNLHI